MCLFAVMGVLIEFIMGIDGLIVCTGNHNKVFF